MADRKRSRRLAYGGVAVALAAIALGVFFCADAWLPNFRVVHPGVLYRSGQPRGPALHVLHAMGVRTLVNLRSPRSDGTDKEKGFAREHGIRFCNIPVGESTQEIREAVDEFRVIMDDPANWPVLVHCSRGKERSGVFSAVYLIEDEGWSNRDALAETHRLGLEPGSMPVAESFILAYGRADAAAESPAPDLPRVPWQE